MRVGTETQKGKIVLTAYDNNTVVARVEGETPQIAARWMVKAVNRIALHTEALLVQMGLITDDECEAVAASIPDQGCSFDPGS